MASEQERKERGLVIMCGLPSSGNRFVSNLIRQAGASTIIHHGQNADLMDLVEAKGNPNLREWIKCVMLVRHTTFRYRSRDRAPLDQQSEWTARTLQQIVKNGWPLLCLSYEAMWLYPVEWKTDLLDWLGLDRYTPWEEWPQDRNAKYLTKPVEPHPEKAL